MQALDLTPALKDYWNTGLYLAMTQDYKRVVGKGKTIQDAWKEAIHNGYQNPIILRAPGDRLGNQL